MTGKRILVPLDLSRGTTDTLLHLQQMAAESPVCATLLHVLELNIEPHDERLFQELREDAESALRKLAALFFGHEQAAGVCARFGRASDEILDEARRIRPDLILMTPPLSRRWHHIFKSRTVDRVLRDAPCPVLVVPFSAKKALCGKPLPARRQNPPPLRATWARA
jgi:nucleotide-binding universal stress UspA family protein